MPGIFSNSASGCPLALYVHQLGDPDGVEEGNADGEKGKVLVDKVEEFPSGDFKGVKGGIDSSANSELLKSSSHSSSANESRSSRPSTSGSIHVPRGPSSGARAAEAGSVAIFNSTFGKRTYVNLQSMLSQIHRCRPNTYQLGLADLDPRIRRPSSL